MKYLVRLFIFNIFALWLTSQINPGFIIHGGWQLLMFSGLILSLLMLIVRPILKILFIPINLITFGLLSWLVNVIVIYLLTFFVPELEVVSWTFPGISWQGFTVPSVHLTYIVSLILVSLMITFFTNILHEISEG